ncbi:MAG: hypothetical protein RLY71_3667 [Pseudomonadota bacterium]|jgi:exonuclease III
MRIITWNCNGALRRKLVALEEIGADVQIIQECENPAATSDRKYRAWAEDGHYLWIGTDKNRGLGVFARPGVAIEPVRLEAGPLELFLPCRVDGMAMLAVWTKRSESWNYRYIGQLWKWLDLNSDFLVGDQTLLIGDLNSNAIWDAQHRGCSHSEVVNILAGLGQLSVYHHLRGEAHGMECTPTLFFRRQIDRPYHIDYAFLSKRLLNGVALKIGQPEHWLALSDHMPVTIDIVK